MGRPPKTQVVETAETPKEELKNNDVLLVKVVNRAVVAKLIEDKANVRHISGSGQVTNPKVWFLETSLNSLDKLTKEEQELVEKTSYDEIKARVKKSIDAKEQERQESAAQKRLPGEPPVPSARY